MKARTSSRLWSRPSASVRTQQGLALGAEVVGPAALDRAQGLGLGPVLLDQREPGLAFLLAEDLAEHPPERVDVAPEGVFFVLARP